MRSDCGSTGNETREGVGDSSSIVSDSMAWGFDVSDMCQRGSRRAILENTPFSLFALKLHVDLNGDAGRFFKHRCHHTYLVSLKNGLKSEEIGGTDGLRKQWIRIVFIISICPIDQRGKTPTAAAVRCLPTSIPPLITAIGS